MNWQHSIIGLKQGTEIRPINRIIIIIPACDAGGISSYCGSIAFAMKLKGYAPHLVIWQDISSPYHRKPKSFWEEYPSVSVTFDSTNKARCVASKLASVILFRDGDIVFSQNFPWISPLIDIVREQGRQGIRHFEFVHGNDSGSYFQALRSYKTVEKYVCVSKEIADNLSKRFLREGLTNEAGVLVCPGGVPKVLDSVPKRSSNPFRFCYIGRLHSVLKSVQYIVPLLRIFNSYQIPYIFTIIGDGPYRRQIEKELAEEISCGKVDMLGVCSHQTVFEKLKANHALILVSKSEGSPMVVCEAMSCGVIPVVTNVGGIPDLVMDREDGFLFPFGDTNMAAVMLRDLASNVDLRWKMANAALDKARSQFQWKDRISNLVKLMESAVDANHMIKRSYNSRTGINKLLESSWMPNFVTMQVRRLHRWLRPLPADVSKR